MVFLKPIDYLVLEFLNELNQLIRIRLRSPSHLIVFYDVSLFATVVKIFGIWFLSLAKYLRKSCQCPVVLQFMGWPVSFGGK